MAKSVQNVCILLVTVVNVVCALICVQSASKRSQSSVMVSGDIGSLKAAVDQQTAVLDRAIGNVVPVKMPPDFESQFVILEDTVKDEKKWPKNQDESNELVNKLASLIKQLPVWAEPDYLPRLTPLRWSVQSFSVLNQYAVPSVDNADTGVAAINSLLDATPDGVPPSIPAALKSALTIYQQKLSSTSRERAIAQANAILKTGKGDAATAWSALEKWTDDPADGTQIQRLRADLRKQALTTDADRQAGMLSAQQKQLGTITDEKLAQQGLIRLYDSAMNQRLALASEGITSPSLDAVADTMQQSLTQLANKESAKQAAKIRAYQKTALDEIQAFWAVKNAADQQAKNAHYVGSSYTDAEYKMLRDALCDHLLPLSSNYLEPPVLQRFNDAFTFGWQQLDKRSEQTEVAERAATVEKRVP